MNIIAMAFVLGGLFLFVLAASAMIWLINANRRAENEQERTEAWNEMLMILQGGWFGEVEDA